MQGENNAVAGPSQPKPPDKDKPKEKRKRVRQRFSCAECRRLKIKCSKVWPCEACVKGGCAQICPDGQLWKSQGRRIFLADSEDLTRRVSMLKQASKQESSPQDPSGNSISPAARTTVTHISHPSNSPHDFDDTIDENNNVGNTLGTLTIGKGNTSRYVGKLAGSEYLHEAAGGRETEDTGLFSQGSSPGPERRKAHTTNRVDPSSRDSPNSVVGVHQVDLQSIRNKLPVWEDEGRALVEIYWNNVDWIQQAVPRPMLDSDFLINAYDVATPPNPHKIACVFLVMALGAMYDLSKDPYQNRGKDLFQLGRSCLEHDSGGQASLATVQAMILSGTYILNDYHNNGAEIFWPIIGSALKIAQSIGLHRDGAQFELSAYDVQVRRQVWWELVTYDRLQALCFGRPCATSNRHTDTQFPDPDEQLMPDMAGYHQSKHRLAFLMERVVDLQNQIAPLSYSAIMEVDHELEDFKKRLPDELLSGLEIEELPLHPMIRPHTVLQRFGIRLLVAQTRLHLNRPAFSRALSSDAMAPDQSRFGGSFMALYTSAQEIVHLVKQLVFYHPSLIARWWAFWFHAFSSAVCLAAIVIQAPKSTFAREALVGMSIVCDLSAAARDGCRAKKGLHTLVRLRKRAQAAMILAAPSEFGTFTGGHVLSVQQRNNLLAQPGMMMNRLNFSTGQGQNQGQSTMNIMGGNNGHSNNTMNNGNRDPQQAQQMVSTSATTYQIPLLHNPQGGNGGNLNTVDPQIVFDQPSAMAQGPQQAQMQQLQHQQQQQSQLEGMQAGQQLPNPFLSPGELEAMQAQAAAGGQSWDSIGFAMDDNLGFNIDDFLNEIREDNFSLIP